MPQGSLVRSLCLPREAEDSARAGVLPSPHGRAGIGAATRPRVRGGGDGGGRGRVAPRSRPCRWPPRPSPGAFRVDRARTRPASTGTTRRGADRGGQSRPAAPGRGPAGRHGLPGPAGAARVAGVVRILASWPDRRRIGSGGRTRLLVVRPRAAGGGPPITALWRSIVDVDHRRERSAAPQDCARLASGVGG